MDDLVLLGVVGCSRVKAGVTYDDSSYCSKALVSSSMSYDESSWVRPWSVV